MIVRPPLGCLPRPFRPSSVSRCAVASFRRFGITPVLFQNMLNYYPTYIISMTYIYIYIYIYEHRFID